MAGEIEEELGEEGGFLCGGKKGRKVEWNVEGYFPMCLFKMGLSWLVGLIWDRMFRGVYSFFKVCKLCKYWLD